MTKADHEVRIHANSDGVWVIVPKQLIADGTAFIHPFNRLAGRGRIGSGSRVDKHVVLGENCTIGPKNRIGEGVWVGDNVITGANVEIGPSSIVEAGANIPAGTIIASNSTITIETYPAAPVALQGA